MPHDEDVITGVLMRLLRYLRGIITLILVDSVIYTAAFWLLGMTRFPIFGVLSGMSVLLPVVGLPIVAVLTVIWCIWCGMIWWKILLVAAVFLVYGCGIEQFAIYPVLVGRALGLAAWEALLAILIGFLIGNVPGLILALPVAGVVKYLFLRSKTGNSGS